MSDTRLILTCGLPGAGKTTLARQLATDRRAVRLTKDEWLWALGPTPWATTTQERVNHELWQLAQQILRLGLSVVVDFGVSLRIERDQMRSVAHALGVGVELHYLDVPVDELWRRIEARNSEPPWDSAPIRRDHRCYRSILASAPRPIQSMTSVRSTSARSERIRRRYVPCTAWCSQPGSGLMAALLDLLPVGGLEDPAEVGYVGLGPPHGPVAQVEPC